MHLTHPDVGPEEISAHDRVRVPDGRIGQVIGFYRREYDDSVIVLFSSGRSTEFLISGVTRSS